MRLCCLLCSRGEPTSMVQTAGYLRQGCKSFPVYQAWGVSLEVEGDASDIPEPGAGSGGSEAVLWHGAWCKEGALLVNWL